MYIVLSNSYLIEKAVVDISLSVFATMSVSIKSQFRLVKPEDSESFIQQMSG